MSFSPQDQPQSFDLAAALSAVNSISLSFNPYPLILQTAIDEKASFFNNQFPALLNVLAIVHFILLIQAALSLCLKIFLKKDGESKKFWLWRKHHVLNQSVPYLVPHGTFLIEPLQILGCLIYEWLAIITHRTIVHPESTSSAVHASVVFTGAVTVLPGFVGFWLSGWSAFYAIFLCPASRNIDTSKRAFFQHPLFMNIVCIAMPVLMTIYFVAFGTVLSFKFKELLDIYASLRMTLKQLSVDWKPNDPMNLENNQKLFNIIETLLSKGPPLATLSEALAYGWATTSIFIITFYIVTAIGVGKVLKHAILIASGQATLSDSSAQMVQKRKQSVSFASDVTQSEKQADQSQATSETYNVTCKKSVSLSKRNYYFVCASCGIMTFALGFTCISSLILGLKIKYIFNETHWQSKLAVVTTCSAVSMSFSLFLQSLMLYFG